MKNLNLRDIQDHFVTEAKMVLAAKLFEMKKLTPGQAAMIAGTDRVNFLMNLHKYGISALNATEEEFRSEVENA